MELFFWDFALQAIVLQIRDTGIVGIEIETESPRLRIPQISGWVHMLFVDNPPSILVLQTYCISD